MATKIGEAVASDLHQKTGKAAVLVIHGIGKQNPYETLDQFARGLADHFQVPQAPPKQQPTLEPLLINHEGWNEVAIRLDLNGQVTVHGFSVLDLYEFYWAPHTEGKITYLQTLSWLRHTALTPLRYLGYGYELFSQSSRLAGAFVRETLRSIFLFIPFALFTYVLAYFLNKAEGVFTKAKVLLEVFRGASVSDQFLLILLLVLVILTSASVRTLWVLRKERKVAKVSGLRGMSPASLKSWTAYGVYSLIFTAAATLGLAILLRRYITRVWFEVFRFHLLFPVVLGLIALWLKNILVEYVGDIAVYVNADAKAVSFQARSAILKEARETILRLLRSREGYERIVLVGHSLGSVIAYDVLNRLLDEARASYAAGPQGVSSGKLVIKDLQPLQGLVTVGSPLDKIYYFFRTEVPAQQAIRAQILSFMHGFRRAPSGRVYGRYQFPPYTIPNPSPNFKWINVWANADPVSGHLDFYRVPNQFERSYPLYLWGRAHVRYWSDPEFYGLVAQNLL